MLRTEMNQNEIAALRRMHGEPSVHSSDFQSSSSSSLLSSPFGEAFSSMPVPETPNNGLLVKIQYSGACFEQGQSRRNRFTPRFPGNEIAGIVHKIGANANCSLSVGERVLVLPSEVNTDGGYAEYIPIHDLSSVVKVPNNVRSEVAAMLPGGALEAYAAVNTAKPFVEKIQKVKPCINVLIIGAHDLGLWTLKTAKYCFREFGCNNVRLFVADNSIDRLLAAQEHECFDIIHWNEEDHEQYIVERTLDSCRGGLDIIMDFVGSNRSMQRSLQVLNREGVILVGGNTTTETSISLTALAAKQQSIVGIPKGNLNQLLELVNAVKENKLEIPTHKVFPIEDANQVFEDICECRITGRAIFRFPSHSNSQTNSNSQRIVNDNLNL